MLERMSSTSGGDSRMDRYTHGAHEIDVLVTGIGMVAMAVWCSHALSRTSYDLAFNFGVCGSFDSSIAPGTVVHIVADRLAELGAEDGDAFLTLEELQLPGESNFTNQNPPLNRGLEQLATVTGITVNTVHGNDRTIASAARRFKPQVESMEGAAFMSACVIHNVPFAQVRAVSNLVERRNRAAWQMDEAIRNLGVAALRIINHL
jgi:futalosine hydrolase